MDASKSDSKKAELYNMLMQEKEKAEVTTKYGNKNVPSHKLQPGLFITLLAIHNKDLGKVRMILCKHHCGSDTILCKKTKDEEIKSLDLKISVGNISCMLTSTNVAE